MKKHALYVIINNNKEFAGIVEENYLYELSENFTAYQLTDEQTAELIKLGKKKIRGLNFIEKIKLIFNKE